MHFMNRFERDSKKTLLDRFSEPPERILIVAGPRQCGKTTALLQALKDCRSGNLYVPVDQPDFIDRHSPLETESTNAIGWPNDHQLFRVTQPDKEWLIRVWQLARLEAQKSESGYILALDEIQKVPNWSKIVKGLWDADRIDGLQMHVVLLGSAPLRIQKGLTESLAGRFETIRLKHWSYAEMSAAFNFDLDQYIYFGGYPGGVSLIADEQRWRNYILDSLAQTSIERDILAMQKIDKPALMKQLFKLGSSYSGKELSFNKMLGSLQDAGNTTTLARYLDLLSQVGLITGLQQYSVEKFRRRASSPKLNVNNTALMSASSDHTFEEARADKTFWGRLVESAVGAHLLNTHSSYAELCYWRKNNFEIDFVLARGRRITLIEVKSGKQQISSKGFQKFEKHHASREVSIKRIEVSSSATLLAEFLATPVSEWLE